MWSRYRPGVAQRVGRGIALLFHDRGIKRGWVVSSTPRPHFIPRERPDTHFTGGCRSGRVEDLVPTRIRSRTVQPVFSRYTDWATGPTIYVYTVCKGKVEISSQTINGLQGVCCVRLEILIPIINGTPKGGPYTIRFWRLSGTDRLTTVSLPRGREPSESSLLEYRISRNKYKICGGAMFVLLLGSNRC